MKKGTIEFYEIQRLRQSWMWVVILSVNLVSLFAVYQHFSWIIGLVRVNRIS